MRQKLTIEQEQNQLQVAEDLFGYSPCEHCQHFHRGERYFKNPFVSCKAFLQAFQERYLKERTCIREATQETEAFI